jgi:DNA-binding LytR/AlgR family response regulator
LDSSFATVLRHREPKLEKQAIELFEQHQPAICFLDVHMPGLSGVEVARHVAKRAHLVFVTAFDQYALEALQHGASDTATQAGEKVSVTVIGPSPPDQPDAH